MPAHSGQHDRDTVVMGSAVGLQVDQIVPFLRSLQNCGYSGDIVLFVGRRLARRLRKKQLQPRVLLVPAPTLLPTNFKRVRENRLAWTQWRVLEALGWACQQALGRFPGSSSPLRRLQMSVAQLVCTPMEARFLCFHRFLARHAYRRILISDVRDVLFQSDPFTQLPPSGLAVSIESRSYTIATEPLNRSWIKSVYGSDALARIGHNTPSCVGVTYGEGAALSMYLRLMVDEILLLDARAAREGGADTAIHNFLLWTNQLGQIRLLETLESPVATLNGIPPEDIDFSPEGRLLNRDGSLPSIVHQYDRQPAVARALLAAMPADPEASRSANR
jgi:hypothetical protein